MGLAAVAALALQLGGAAAAAVDGRTVDGAGNAMLAFEPVAGAAAAVDGAGPASRHCTADRQWCAELSAAGEGDGGQLRLFRAGAAMALAEVAGTDDEDADHALWPHIVVEAGGDVLVGVERTRSMSFSGGSSSASRLLLYRVAPGGSAALVMEIPVAGSGLYRACYSKEEQRRRGDGCSERFEFEAGIALDRGRSAGRARLILTARARTWPGPQRLGDEDSRRYRRSDLVWAEDRACSYRRLLSFSEAEGRYVPDRPLPPCEDYFNV